MTADLWSEIDDALAGYGAATSDELKAFTEATCRSALFQQEVAAGVRMLVEGQCVPETLWALMIVMLRTGITIERRRHEVGQLKRMYEGGAA